MHPQDAVLVRAEELLRLLFGGVRPHDAARVRRVTLDGLSPEERMMGLKPEQRLAGLPPERAALAFPTEALRALSAEYIATLPDDVQAEIRARLAR